MRCTHSLAVLLTPSTLPSLLCLSPANQTGWCFGIIRTFKLNKINFLFSNNTVAVFKFSGTLPLRGSIYAFSPGICQACYCFDQLCMEKMTPWCLSWLLKQAASVCFSWYSLHAPVLRGSRLTMFVAGYSQSSVTVLRSQRHTRGPVEVLQGESLPTFWPTVSIGDQHCAGATLYSPSS